MERIEVITENTTNPLTSEQMTDSEVSEYIKGEIRAGLKANILIGRELRVFLNDGRYKSLGFEGERNYLESLQSENLWSVATSYNWMNSAVLADTMGFEPSDLIGMPMVAVYKAGSLISAHKVSDDNTASFKAMVESLRGMKGADAVDVVQKWESDHSTKRVHGNSGKSSNKSGKRPTAKQDSSGDSDTDNDSTDSSGIKITARALRCEIKFTGKALEALYAFMRSNGVPSGKTEEMGGDALLKALAKLTTATASKVNQTATATASASVN